MSANYWQGDLVRLRPLALADVDAWLAEDTDSEAIRGLNFGMQLLRLRAMAEEWAAQFADFGKSDEFIFFSIETLSGEYVGNINIHGMDHGNGVFETGMRLFAAIAGEAMPWRRSASSSATPSTSCAFRSTACAALR